MLNMMVAVGLFPVTGQPLPLISKGGTSTLINCAYIGMILSVSRYVADKEEQRRQAELAANDEKLQAAAQALILQAKEMVNNEEENSDEVLAEALQAVQATDISSNRESENNGV